MVRELTTMIAEVRALNDDELLWTCPSGITNSIGTLGLHMAGSLRHFVGAGMGTTGYVRDRPHEFAARGLSGDAVIATLEAAIADIRATLPTLSEAKLSEEVLINGVTMSNSLFLLHMCAHTALHVGQAGYLRRILTGQNESVGVALMSALVG